MLYVFCINRVKLVARKQKTTDNLGQREYEPTLYTTISTYFMTIP